MSAATELTYWWVRTPGVGLPLAALDAEAIRHSCIDIWSALTSSGMCPEEFDAILETVNRPLYTTIPVPAVPRPNKCDGVVDFGTFWPVLAGLPPQRLALMVAACAAAALRQLLKVAPIDLASPAFGHEQHVFDHIELWSLSMLLSPSNDGLMPHRPRALMCVNIHNLGRHAMLRLQA
jgi:hypothetical protein